MARKAKHSKPLPAPPKGPPSDLAPRSAANALKRAALFELNEAAQPFEKRLANRTDLEEGGKKLYTAYWFKRMDTEMRLWSEFLAGQHGRTDAVDFFRPRGPLPTIELLNGYFYWVAQTSVGKLYDSSHEPSTLSENKKVTVNTMIVHLHALRSAFSYFNVSLSPDLIESVRLRISNDLAQEIGLNTESKLKTTAYTADVDRLIKAIWRFDSFAVFKSIRCMLYTTLILNLLVDGASRIGELVTRDDSNSTGLLWEHIDFWITKSDNPDGFTIHAVILCKWLKGHTHDPNVFKSFVVRLLPPNMVFQDSCRLLVLLGLHRGVFRDFNTWDEIMSCDPLESGSKILVKDAYTKQPIFAAMEPRLAEINGVDSAADGHNGGDETQVETRKMSWPYTSLAGIVQHLSRLAGLANKTELHLLRRGNAFLLLKHCTDRDEARQMMGQREGSTVFSKYLSRTSTTDLQGISRDVPTEDISRFSGLTLGRVDDAPITLPQSDLAALEQEPAYVERKTVVSDLEISIQAEFGSLRNLRHAAKESEEAAALLRDRGRAISAVSTTFRRLAEVKFRQYREAEIKELTAAKPSPTMTSGPSSIMQKGATQGGKSTLSNQGDSAGGAMTVDDSDGMDIATVKEAVGVLSVEDARRLVVEFDRDGNPNNNPNNNSTHHLDPLSRKHGFFRGDLNSQVGRVGRKFTMMTHFSPFIAKLAYIYNELTGTQDEDGGEQDSRTVMARLVTLLSSDQHGYDLPDNWINKSQPSHCVLCHEPLEVTTAFKHVYDCQRTRAQATAARMWQDYIESLPLVCDFQSHGTRKQDQSCAKSHKLAEMTPKERQLHVVNGHNSSGKKRYYCGYGDCPGAKDLPLYIGRDEYTAHLWREHGLLARLSDKSLYFFCWFCREFIFHNTDSLEREEHFHGHLDEALDIVHEYGYAGVRLMARGFLPGLCIFCLHTEELPYRQRAQALTSWFSDGGGHADIGAHLHCHIKALEDSEEDLTCPGVAGEMCSHTSTMSREQLWDHICQVHYGLSFADKYGPSKEGRVQGKGPKRTTQTKSKFFAKS